MVRPPRFPDLMPLDLFLWRYVKDNLADLHRRIGGACQIVTKEMLQNTWQEAKYCLDVVQSTRGAQ